MSEFFSFEDQFKSLFQLIEVSHGTIFVEIRSLLERLHKLFESHVSSLRIDPRFDQLAPQLHQLELSLRDQSMHPLTTFLFPEQFYKDISLCISQIHSILRHASLHMRESGPRDATKEVVKALKSFLNSLNKEAFEDMELRAHILDLVHRSFDGFPPATLADLQERGYPSPNDEFAILKEKYNRSLIEKEEQEFIAHWVNDLMQNMDVQALTHIPLLDRRRGGREGGMRSPSASFLLDSSEDDAEVSVESTHGEGPTSSPPASGGSSGMSELESSTCLSEWNDYQLTFYSSLVWILNSCYLVSYAMETSLLEEQLFDRSHVSHRMLEALSGQSALVGVGIATLGPILASINLKSLDKKFNSFAGLVDDAPQMMELAEHVARKLTQLNCLLSKSILSPMKEGHRDPHTKVQDYPNQLTVVSPILSVEGLDAFIHAHALPMDASEQEYFRHWIRYSHSSHEGFLYLGRQQHDSSRFYAPPDASHASNELRSFSSASDINDGPYDSPLTTLHQFTKAYWEANSFYDRHTPPSMLGLRDALAVARLVVKNIFSGKYESIRGLRQDSKPHSSARTHAPKTQDLAAVKSAVLLDITSEYFTLHPAVIDYATSLGRTVFDQYNELVGYKPREAGAGQESQEASGSAEDDEASKRAYFLECFVHAILKFPEVLMVCHNEKAKRDIFLKGLVLELQNSEIEGKESVAAAAQDTSVLLLPEHVSSGLFLEIIRKGAPEIVQSPTDEYGVLSCFL